MNAAGERVIALAGNPNVGKSTLFNALSGLRQHTGNWPGKTVEVARGSCVHQGERLELVDLPGTYSLSARSPEEEIARAFLTGGEADAAVVVCDAVCLERNLILALQVMECIPHVVVCVNLLDEARDRGITVDLEALAKGLGVRVVGTSAAREEGLEELLEAAVTAAGEPPRPLPPAPADGMERVRRAEKLAGRAVSCRRADPMDRDRRLDRLLTSRLTGIPVMLALLGLVLWLTIAGANYPSAWLSAGLGQVEEWLSWLFHAMGAPAWLHDALVLGVFKVLAWVVSVMLPPMAIFFPLFTLLEDLGYLPRVAFLLDHAFQKARACGKQALTMCQGFGCNAVGVEGCRIIDSPRERLIAILTNSLVPCNGRFPTLLMLLSIFFVGSGPWASLQAAGLLLALLVLGVGMTFLCSRLLSATVLRGVPSSFTLELPPFRKPRVGQVVARSVLDRTLFVLGRAAAVAAPAGLVIWLCANVTVGERSILDHCTAFLDPVGRFMGLDGVLLMAFILGFPANEIVLPIALMAYLSKGTLVEAESAAAVGALLAGQGWTEVTAVCTMVFSLFHWPCSTTCLTIYKETGSLKWTAGAILLPTAVGVTLCAAIAAAGRLLGVG